MMMYHECCADVSPESVTTIEHSERDGWEICLEVLSDDGWGGTVTDYEYRKINYCPFCGEKLKNTPQKDVSRLPTAPSKE